MQRQGKASLSPCLLFFRARKGQPKRSRTSAAFSNESQCKSRERLLFFLVFFSLEQEKVSPKETARLRRSPTKANAKTGKGFSFFLSSFL
jgi:hypothetical protein